MVVVSKGFSSFTELAEIYSLSNTFFDDCCCVFGGCGD